LFRWRGRLVGVVAMALLVDQMFRDLVVAGFGAVGQRMALAAFVRSVSLSNHLDAPSPNKRKAAGKVPRRPFHMVSGRKPTARKRLKSLGFQLPNGLDRPLW
jgi:hypothetical protein